MSEENVRMVLEGVDAWNAGDLDRALDRIHPDIVWINSGAIPDLKVEYRGHEGVRDFWEDWRSVWQEIVVEPERIVDLGDRVLVLARFDGIARGDVRVSSHFGQVYELADGKIARFRSFTDWAEAVRSVGLDPESIPA
jgi:ketosteroid isomerase-like protein